MRDDGGVVAFMRDGGGVGGVECLRDDGGVVAFMRDGGGVVGGVKCLREDGGGVAFVRDDDRGLAFVRDDGKSFSPTCDDRDAFLNWRCMAGEMPLGFRACLSNALTALTFDRSVFAFAFTCCFRALLRRWLWITVAASESRWRVASRASACDPRHAPLGIIMNAYATCHTPCTCHAHDIRTCFSRRRSLAS